MDAAVSLYTSILILQRRTSVLITTVREPFTSLLYAVWLNRTLFLFQDYLIITQKLAMVAMKR